MKKIYFLIAAALLAVTFTSCQKDEEMNEQVNKETNEQDLYGKWQNKKNTQWYRVFYNDIVADDPTYKWGKEWHENEGIYEKDLTEHGNGWFKWRKSNNNLLEIEMMEYGWAEIPQENTITVLTDTEFSYKRQDGTIYSFTKVKE